MKNILIVTKEYKHPSLPKVGGTGIFYKNLCAKLNDSGLSVKVFLITNNKYQIEDENVEIYAIKDIFKSNFALEFIRSISGKIGLLNSLHNKIYLLEKRIIKKKLGKWIKINNYNFDIIETHDFDGLALSLPDNIPHIIRCHGSWTILKKYFGYQNVQSGRIFCEKQAFKNSKNIITVSKYSQKLNYETFNVYSKTIHNGINVQDFTPDNTKIIEHSIFFVGTASKEKGFYTALETFRSILEKEPQTTFHIIGNMTKQAEKTLALLDQNIRTQIIFYNYLEKNEIIEKIRKAHVLLYPSEGETFGLALCEAMALRKPVICSGIEAFQEIIQHQKNGIIASTKNDFIDAVEMIFSDNILSEKISSNAENTIKTTYNLESTVFHTINYYNELLK
ncbi:glycosyltransferase family 4 protein [Chryseobacterium sp. Leaf201]|uniref:glycosyltransferase family 4 protein n=1 Tax=Chryseobacterium sp. Leaf201 TaxID=1735672 RepID=UPI0006FD2EF2|nr:glycosyltransferase family 4 protein [Chryseobacterium sp. Leaf201]KQM62607.1 hypothetical protein ASE55_06725 [Chryseobacterium sp. Leaf201]